MNNLDSNMESIIVFDTETTGLLKPLLSPLKEQPQIIEFAGIKLNSDLEEIDRIEFFVDPGIDVPKHITKINNITTDQVKGVGDFATHLKKLQRFFLGAKEMVAHNLKFDSGMLRVELARLDKLIQFPWPPVHTCTVETTLHIKNHRMKLSGLHQHCTGEDFGGAHRAMVDTEALTRCYIHLKKEGVI